MWYLKLIIFFIVISFVLYFVWSYIFSIYEIGYEQKITDSNNGKLITITAYPVNGYGFRVPLRSVEVLFDLPDSAEAEIINHEQNRAVIFTPIKNGTIIVKTRSNKYDISEILKIEIGEIRNE